MPLVLTATCTSTANPAPRLAIEVGDDLALAEAEGALWRCELVVSVSRLAHTDEVEIEWNGTSLPSRWVSRLQSRTSRSYYTPPTMNIRCGPLYHSSPLRNVEKVLMSRTEKLRKVSDVLRNCTEK